MDREFSLIRKIPLTRKTIYLSLLICFFIPVILVCSYGAVVGAKGIFYIAVLSTVLGGAGGWFLLLIWEKKMQYSVSQIVQTKIEKMQEMQLLPSENTPHGLKTASLMEELERAKISYEHQINLMQSSMAKSKDEVHQLNLEMDKKLEEMRLTYLEFEDFRKEYHRLEEETAHLYEDSQKKLEHKDALLNEYQRTMSEQRMIIEKKQRYIAKLEGKVRDLMYEIRSLIQLETTPSGARELVGGLDVSEQEMIDSFLLASSSTHTPYDFSVQLHKYIEKAENLTGVDHLGYVGGKSPRFLDLPLDCYAIDRRRLFDSFKDETAGIVFIYSPLEKKFLFVNPVVKSLTGWSPEKFMKEFPRLVTQGFLDWEKALSKIKSLKECSTRMTILDKTGHPKPFECYMGVIVKGPFTQHVVGVLINL